MLGWVRWFTGDPLKRHPNPARHRGFPPDLWPGPASKAYSLSGSVPSIRLVALMQTVISFNVPHDERVLTGQSPPKSKNHPSLMKPSKMAISTIIPSKLRTMPAEAILLRYSWPMRTCPVRGAPAMSVKQLSQGLRSITANGLLSKAKVTTSAGRVISFTSPTRRFPVKER